MSEITPVAVRRYLMGKDVKGDLPIADTGELADHFDVDRQTVLEKIKQIESSGQIKRQEIGQSYCWYASDRTWPPSEGSRRPQS